MSEEIKNPNEELEQTKDNLNQARRTAHRLGYITQLMRDANQNQLVTAAEALAGKDDIINSLSNESRTEIARLQSEITDVKKRLSDTLELNARIDAELFELKTADKVEKNKINHERNKNKELSNALDRMISVFLWLKDHGRIDSVAVADAMKDAQHVLDVYGISLATDVLDNLPDNE